MRKVLHKIEAVAGLAARLGLSRRTVVLLFLGNALAIIFEALGVATLLPIFEMLRSGGTVDSAKLTGRHWDMLREVASVLGIPITLGFLLLLSFVMICMRQLFSYLNGRAYGMAQLRLANKIRHRAFMGFLRTDMSLQDRARVGEIAADLTSELDRALATIFVIVRVFSTCLQMVVYLTGLFFLSVQMTLISLCLMAIGVYFTRGLLGEIKRAGVAITDYNVQLTAFIVERLKHARLIRLSGTEKAEAAAFTELSIKHSQHTVEQKLAASKLNLLPEPIALGFSYVVLYAGAQVFGLSFDRLGLFVVVLIRLMPILRGIIGDYNTITGKWPSAIRVDKQLSKILDAREPKGGSIAFERLEHGIRFESVSFSYPTNEVPALCNLTVTVPAHRMTALVGPSGAGKSTFVDLLPLLRYPSDGRIFFDDLPFDAYSVASLRAGIAFVPQQPQIFDITASEHIRYGKEDASDAEVREAARLAGVLSFIERLPQGFNTQLGDHGNRLSGGQRQRLDIARALVRRAPILILDEPTSALDAEAEAAFRDALRVLRSETQLTIIVIAHRLSTVADADRIIVLDEGRLVASGTHHELMTIDGWYANAYGIQRGSLDQFASSPSLAATND